MRLFTAIDLSDEVVQNLAGLIDRLRPTAPIKWSPRENLHVTTKFIGEWPEERLGELKTSLGGLPARAPIAVHLAKLGYFPNPHSPRVFWAGIDAPGLAELAHDIDQVLSLIGVPKEQRAFSPHLTLARIKEPVTMSGLLQAVAHLPSLDFGECIVDRSYLYHSRLGSGGSTYTKLAEFKFS